MAAHQTHLGKFFKSQGPNQFPDNKNLRSMVQVPEFFEALQVILSLAKVEDHAIRGIPTLLISDVLAICTVPTFEKCGGSFYLWLLLKRFPHGPCLSCSVLSRYGASTGGLGSQKIPPRQMNY